MSIEPAESYVKVLNAVVLKIGLSLVLAPILLAGAVGAKESIPNLDGNSQPNRATLAECIADVKEVTAWDEQQTRQAASELCRLRQEHAQAKQRFLTAIANLRQEYKDRTNHGFSEHLPAAIEDAWTMVKTCIHFKEGFTAPHNVATLNVPEEIRISCYAVGTNLVKAELFTDK